MGMKLTPMKTNRALAHGLLTGNYFCVECASKMKFEDKNRDTLVCKKCGHSVSLDMYGLESPEDYDTVFGVFKKKKKKKKK